MEETEYTAWRTGFEMAMDAILEDDKKKAPEEFAKQIASGEYNDLLLALNVGRHELHGIWMIVGLRMAIYMTLLTDWEPEVRKDSELMNDLWLSIENQSPEILAAVTAEELSNQLMIPIVMIDSDASAFISSYLR